MRLPILLLLTVALAAGCEQGPQTVHTTNKPVTSPSTDHTAPAVQPAGSESKPAAHQTAAEPAADNTAVNARDKDPVAKSPLDQSEAPEDLKVTADIRKKVLEQPDFSVDARNVKIITTADGKVTLRGPVKTESERDIINKIARLVAGEDKVDSQLEIAP
ncbi:MAG: transport-associated protein [Planctomycetaceae bacterium]|nr:transport-associated protein [Planctomycetaceae bacterium]